MTVEDIQALVGRWNQDGRSLTGWGEDGCILLDSVPIEDTVLVRVAPHMDRAGQIVRIECWLGVKLCGWYYEAHYAHVIHAVELTVDGADQMDLTDDYGRRFRIHAFTDEDDSGIWYIARKHRESNEDDYRRADQRVLDWFEEVASR